MRVAYYSPLPPERTGVADYSALLVPALGRRVDLDVQRRGRKRAPHGADLCLYHVGNNPDAHAWIVDALRRRPGVVVLHDFVLHHFMLWYAANVRRDVQLYVQEMGERYGEAGAHMAQLMIRSRFTDAAFPWWDAAVAMLSVAAQILQSRRYFESWVLWIAVDLLAVGLYAARGLWLTAGLYLVFLVLAVWGLIEWARARKA